MMNVEPKAPAFGSTFIVPRSLFIVLFFGNARRAGRTQTVRRLRPGAARLHTCHAKNISSDEPF